MIRRTVRADATDPRAGMTLAELAAFVQAALREDADDNQPVRVRVNIRGGIKQVETR